MRLSCFKSQFKKRSSPNSAMVMDETGLEGCSLGWGKQIGGFFWKSEQVEDFRRRIAGHDLLGTKRKCGGQCSALHSPTEQAHSINEASFLLSQIFLFLLPMWWSVQGLITKVPLFAYPSLYSVTFYRFPLYFSPFHLRQGKTQRF